MEDTDTYYDAYSLDLGHKLEFWLRRSGTWRKIYWGSGTLSIALSTLSAGHVCPEPYQTIAAWLSTSVIGFIGFANPDRQAARYLRAYVIMEPALRDYRAGNMDSRTLTQLHRQAEEALHGTGQNSNTYPNSASSSPAKQTASTNDNSSSSAK